MNNETYEALKRILEYVEIERDDMHWKATNPLRVDIDIINGWIEETEKEHEPNKIFICLRCKRPITTDTVCNVCKLKIKLANQA